MFIGFQDGVLVGGGVDERGDVGLLVVGCTIIVGIAVVGALLFLLVGDVVIVEVLVGGGVLSLEDGEVWSGLAAYGGEGAAGVESLVVGGEGEDVGTIVRVRIEISNDASGGIEGSEAVASYVTVDGGKPATDVENVTITSDSQGAGTVYIGIKTRSGAGGGIKSC